MEQPSLSIIITGQNNKKNIDVIISEAKKLNSLEIILLLNVSNDETLKNAERWGAQVFQFGSEVMSHKMRAFGAKRAKGNILLFLDAAFVISAIDLKLFILHVQNKKVDLALSSFAQFPQNGFFNTVSSEYILNIVAKRRDLGCGSLYNVPFVISRKALMLIGPDSLAVPPLAKINALKEGLIVEAFHVGTSDRIRFDKNDIKSYQVTEECLQSLSSWLRSNGKRSGYTNLGRRLDTLKIQNDDVQPFHLGVTAVIAASNEEGTIGSIVRNAFDAGASQVVVVENGSTDNTAIIARSAGAKVVSYPNRIGHDVGRAVGVIKFPSTYYLFLDGDMIIPAKELKPFIKAVTKDGVDVALNDLSLLLRTYPRWDEVSWSKYFINCALNREDLDVNTLTAVPHAISGRAIDLIGVENLAVPTVATVLSVLAGLNVKAIKEIDVISNNRVRDELHLSVNGNLTEQLILGDMCQGIYELILHKYGRIV